MLLRYSGSVGAGAIVTAALIYWMQLMTAGGEFESPQRRPVLLMPPLKVEPPPLPVRPPPPEPPAPRTAPPDTTIPISDPTTDRPVPGSPVTPPGRPRPPGRPGGRSGPWAVDSELVLVARVEPAYPYSAILKEREGYVVVQFTVTSRGTVDHVRIVESTDRVFEQAAAAAIARARYRPRVVDGLAVDTPGQQTRIDFRLD